MEKSQHPLSGPLFRAVLALATSALLLLVMYVWSIESSVPEGADRTAPLEILGKSMQAVVGGAEVRGEQLAITAYHSEDDELSAVAVWRGRFQAADYPLLQYQIDSDFPGAQLTLIWRTSSEPDILHHTDLIGSVREASWLDLSGHPNWQGTVEEIGVFAFVNAADQALSISHLTLQPLSWRSVMAAHWSDWTTFRGWSTQSINYLYGTPDPHALSPVLVAATWSTLAVGLLLLAGRRGGRWRPTALAAAVLLPWVCLDVLWQKELLSQLHYTRNLFAGKTVQEKHLADIDGDIYRYISRLKDEVLPANPARIVVLHNSRNHEFTRLKAQYYLLPHNVYNFGRMPPKAGVEGVDYILILGEVRGLELDPQTNTLVWRYGKRTLAVEPLDSDPMGQLYRVLPSRPGVEHKS